jgi:hypothetical protein
MGRGAGRGMSMRGGFQAEPPAQLATDAPLEPELAQLRGTLKRLRQQLAGTMDKIEKLEV